MRVQLISIITAAVSGRQVRRRSGFLARALCFLIGCIGAGQGHATCPIIVGGVFNVASNATGGTGGSASPYTGWESCLNSLPDGADIYFPPAFYRLSMTIDAGNKKGWTLHGGGMYASQISAASGFTTGDMIHWGSSGTINTSAAAYLSIHDLGINASAAATTSAAIDILGGSFVYMRNVLVNGFGVGIVLNQAEIVDIQDCVLSAQSNSVAGIYLVNGNYDPSGSSVVVSGASKGYTNRISISNNQLNGFGASSYVAIYDEGGTHHSIRDNNINGGNRAVFMASVTSGQIEGNEIEATGSEAIYIDQVAPNETGLSPYSVNLAIRDNSISYSSSPGSKSMASVLFAQPTGSGAKNPFVWGASLTDNKLYSVNSGNDSISGAQYTTGLVAHSNYNGYVGPQNSEVGSAVLEARGVVSISAAQALNPTALPTPPANTYYLYVDAIDNRLKAKGSSGVITPLTP